MSRQPTTPPVTVQDVIAGVVMIALVFAFGYSLYVRARDSITDPKTQTCECVCKGDKS